MICKYIYYVFIDCVFEFDKGLVIEVWGQD